MGGKYKPKKKKRAPVIVTAREFEKAKQEITTNVLATVLSIPVVVLHDDFKFGKGRLNKFIDRFAAHYHCIGETCSLDDLKGLAEDLLGAEIIQRIREDEQSQSACNLQGTNQDFIGVVKDSGD